MCWQECEEIRTLLHGWRECKLWQTVRWFLSKLEVPYIYMVYIYIYGIYIYMVYIYLVYIYIVCIYIYIYIYGIWCVCIYIYIYKRNSIWPSNFTSRYIPTPQNWKHVFKQKLAYEWSKQHCSQYTKCGNNQTVYHHRWVNKI